MDQLICEVFDSESDKLYVPINLAPKDKVPQLWGFKLPGNDELVARMVSYASKGDAIKKVKVGDKYAHVILMSLSKNGTPAELRGGLGSDPIGALNSIFEAVYKTVLNTKMDAVLFRFPAKKMKGQEKTLQRIMARLVMQRSGGKFVVLDDLYQFTGKHAYILIKRKNVALDSIRGIPDIDHDEYTKVESKVGDVYVKQSTGEKVSKDEAIAASIAAVEEKRTDRSVIARTHVEHQKARELQLAYIDNYLNTYGPKELEFYQNLEPLDNIKLTEVENKIVLPGTLLDNIGHLIKPDLIPSAPENILREIRFILSKHNSNEMLYAFMDIQQYLGVAAPEKKQAITEELLLYFIRISDKYEDLFEDMRPNKVYSKEERTAIQDYAGSWFAEMNDFLMGSNPNPMINEVKHRIENLDSAFKKGLTIPKGTLLYRYQGIPVELFKKSLELNQFYFPNYVSTSVAPSLFMNFKDSLTSTLHKDTSEEVVMTSNKVTIALIIKGADKVPIVIPGELSNYAQEAEVILPRGTTIRYDNIEYAGRIAIIEATVVSSNTEEIKESSGSKFGDFVISESIGNKLARSEALKTVAQIAAQAYENAPDKFK
ncbi:Alt-like RNA polymerase ADP-ribosyltransferase [Pseudomonas phage PspYZU05]|uniref:NAD(+)--arginine ADP-ribosyltransferase n=1 Tax=Pseudomonas phage PspYZU05 TaxID=1983556 RepID=A0A2U7NLW4_9CAUD|nr:Alt-like RNA polymerase ADP-ribosyltransferase [Pseudomonas phage PspYZU05]ASD52108.1 RNA polymerase-ADP-ribosyltransferase [Pseudomonas phage PspYZU05]